VCATTSLRSCAGIAGFRRFPVVAAMSNHGAFGGMLQPLPAFGDCA
jgi:hypothetical protein